MLSFLSRLVSSGSVSRLSAFTVENMSVCIRITCPCNVYHLKPHFYIVKRGYTEVYNFSLFFDQKHRLCVLVRTALAMQL